MDNENKCNKLIININNNEPENIKNKNKNNNSEGDNGKEYDAGMPCNNFNYSVFFELIISFDPILIRFVHH